MEEKYCQCCGMCIDEPKKFGTQADGRKYEEYCCYCWANGEFADWCREITLDEMIEENIRFVLEANPDMTADAAREMLRASMPKLRRWAEAG